MIVLDHVSKSYPTRHGQITVLDDIDLTIKPGEKVGILGRNGAGKSTLIRLISGAERPTKGAVERRMSVSWPLAFGGAFQSALTGLDNLRFICRIYGIDAKDKIDYVQEFSELGRFLGEPIRSYSSGMRARLAFAISMVIEFDCFLIDEVVAVGDARFQEKCHEELFVKRADRAMIIVSHDMTYINHHCERTSVIHQGRCFNFDNIEDGAEYYQATYA
ncbi:ABC-type polysaccharide/polyol phosphate transport system ATPase subunit [Sphingomonas zeicaulis]|uniref:ABC transporter ATP-binding protein n=1 Tax=Sphingomonas zeicaulis TaxID=1632740 RepID=UPI003D22F96B